MRNAVRPDRRTAGGMSNLPDSYPNLIPLPAAEARRIGAVAARYDFDRIYGAWVDAVVDNDAREAVARSVARYAGAVEKGMAG